MLDLATLTGAMSVALGAGATGTFTNSSTLYSGLSHSDYKLRVVKSVSHSTLSYSTLSHSTLWNSTLWNSTLWNSTLWNSTLWNSTLSQSNFYL